MSETLLVTDQGTNDQIQVEVWEGKILLTPDTEFTLLLEKDEVKKLADYLNAFLIEDDDYAE